MKYCPYCGATLVGGAVAFCSKCGKRLPTQSSAKGISGKKPAPREDGCNPNASERIPGVGKHGRKAKQLGKKVNSSRQQPSTRQRSDQHELERELRRNPHNEGYDGYYDDVKPIDDGPMRNKSVPQLLKKVAIIAGSAIGVVILSALLMYLL